MLLKDIQAMFNHACTHIFKGLNFLVLFFALLLSGLVFLFFQGIAFYATNWLQLLFRYLPLFIITAILMAAGGLLIRMEGLIKMDRQQKEGEEKGFKELLSSWDPLIKALYFALPLLFAFLIFWLLLGVFMMLKAIPLLGKFLGIILAFAPYTLNLAIILLPVCAVAILFFFTPVLALKTELDWTVLRARMRADIFTHSLLLVIAFFPLWLAWKLASYALLLTFAIYSFGDSPFERGLQAFFMLIPYAAFLTPPLLFFFNFSLEAYRLTEVPD